MASEARTDASTSGLSQSEQSFLRQLVATAPSSGAARLRALLVRPDVDAKTTTAALVDATAAVPFTDARAGLFRDALATSPSVSARSALAPIIAAATLARADAVVGAHGAHLEGHGEAIGELLRIYAFVETELSAPRKARAMSTEPSALNDGAFERIGSQLAAHMASHRALFGVTEPVSSGLARVRAQASIALLELAGEGVARRTDAVRLFGVTGARAQMLGEQSVLLLDDGRADEARLAAVRGIFERLPGARAGVDAFAFGDERAPYAARSIVVPMRARLDGHGPSRGVLAWHEDVDPGPIDDALADLTLELAQRAVLRAFDARPELRTQADRDAAGAAADPRKTIGRPLDATAQATMSAAVALLAVDAPRALELAASRFAAHRPETAALVADALGVLATTAPARGPEHRPVAVGRPKADGSTETVALRVLRTDNAGAVVAFELAGTRWEIERGAQGVVKSLSRDGQSVKAAPLAAHIPVSDAFAWKSDGGLVFARVLGMPHAGMGGGSRIRLVGGSSGVDAVATPAPSADFELDAVLSVRNDEGGLAFRASAEDATLKGVSVVIVPAAAGQPARATLVLTEGAGVRELAPAVTLPKGDSVAVHVVIRGQRVKANVAGQVLESALPAGIDGNAIALYARGNAVLEASGFRVAKAH